MAKYCVHKTKDYTVMSNIHLRERRMSLKAKGLLSLMLALPDDWDYSIEGLVAICKENESAIKSTLDELKDFGYLVVTKLMPNQTQSGRFEYVYDIYETPTRGEKQGIVKQGIEKQPVEIQGVENPPRLNTNKLNTKVLNTENREGDTYPVIPQICENLANSPSKSEISPELTETTSEISHPAECPQHFPKTVAVMFNAICTSLTPVQYITSKRDAAARKLYPICSTEKIRRCFEIAEASDFLKGKNERGWKATFDWLIDPDNMAKVLEGNFSNDSPSAITGSSFDTDDFFQAAVAKFLGEDTEPA